VHAPITICLHEILGFFFRHAAAGRRYLREVLCTGRYPRERERERDDDKTADVDYKDDEETSLDRTSWKNSCGSAEIWICR